MPESTGRRRWRRNPFGSRGSSALPIRGDRMFNFVKLKMTCCAADAYGEPVKVIVDSPKPLDLDKLKDRWVRVVGKLDYRKAGDSDRYITVVKAESVKAIPTPANQFDN